MAKHGSQSSERQIPQPPHPSSRANVAGPYLYQYPNQSPITTGYNQALPARGNAFRSPAASTPFQPGLPFQRGQPPRSQQNISAAPHMYTMQPHMGVQPIAAPYVLPISHSALLNVDLTRVT
jgi:hypothetical protein